ncbi:MAG: hypothetical protein COT73_11340 [Bdellovibrio sp. CG10_big_fil_rev_8_21_14_0_10_47_8]|nr:MAG: hypothetical protein COT73_11340 [Bdellovibrio sp. CG10_big_fil_rev_8_21_14_0_10_47_8]
MAGGGGTEPNLTPFIDLFSVLICFLLMSAAFLQLESVQVQIEQKPMLNPDVALENPPPPEPEDKKVKLTLSLSKTRILAKENEIERAFVITDTEVGSPELARLLESWHSRFGAKQTLVLQSGDAATYGQLIRLYDFVTHSGWPEVGINPY